MIVVSNVAAGLVATVLGASVFVVSDVAAGFVALLFELDHPASWVLTVLGASVFVVLDVAGGFLAAQVEAAASDVAEGLLAMLLVSVYKSNQAC